MLNKILISSTCLLLSGCFYFLSDFYTPLEDVKNGYESTDKPLLLIEVEFQPKIKQGDVNLYMPRGDKNSINFI